MDNITDLELAWMAGLLEGEGTFTPVRCKNRKKTHFYSSPRVQLQSQDRDVVARVAKLLEANVLGPYSQKRSNKPGGYSTDNHKDCWVVSIAGKKAGLILDKLLPFMGERRTGQIKFALKEWGRHEIDNPCKPIRNQKKPAKRRKKAGADGENIQR